MRTEHVAYKVFSFDELADEAKEVARDNHRDDLAHEEWWYDVYEDAKMCAAIIGIDIETIYFSGFSSQCDGACFEGSYEYKQNWKQQLASEIGGDDLPILMALGEHLQAARWMHGYDLTATTKQTGRYMHSGCMSVDVLVNGEEPSTATEEDDAGILTFAMCLFADWIYRKLGKEHDYMTSDECTDARLRDGHEFMATGQDYRKPVTAEIVTKPVYANKDQLALDAAHMILRTVAEQPIIGWRPVQLTAKIQVIVRKALDKAEEVQSET